MKKYFKSTNEVVLSTWNSYHQQCEALKKSFNEFAHHFDAEAVFTYQVTGHEFYALVLNNYESRADADLWTKPLSREANTSRVRSSIKGKDNAQRLRELKAKYKELKPSQTKIPLDDMYEAIGTHWGDIAFTGIQWFEFDGAIYIASSLNLSKNVEEITGSEFQTAKQDKEAKPKAA
ncbi:hypothetical protein G6Z94_09285 [Vibrio aestuarianus]|uniref:hypothetical protein n=1 Tax=Vibrio aestuarianus TaxID=28171 RepID=UPI0015934AAB|nr:hypothetical protein [Vibrio aestuarianus]NGZ17536.1 hypothetical protein [Vibrio aestuarianus]